MKFPPMVLYWAFVLWTVAQSCCAQGNGGEQLVVFLDAGSTGTRLYVYKYWNETLSRSWIRKRPMITQMVKLTSGVSSEVPLAAYSTRDVGAIKDYLRPFIVRAKNYTVGVEAVTPVFLYATAGVRLLPVQQRSRLFQMVREAFRDKSFSPFFFQDNHAIVLSGEQEAVYANVAANMLLAPEEYEFATVEIGGASAQITFAASADSFPMEEYYELVMQNRRTPQYAVSFLGFGGNEAFSQYNTTLQANASYVTSPCLFTGYVAGGKPSQGDFPACRDAIRDLVFLPSQPRRQLYGDETSIAGVYVPDIPDVNGLIILGGTSYYVNSYTGCASGITSIECFIERGIKLCEKPWSEIGPDRRVANYCFNIAYLVEFLTAMRVSHSRRLLVYAAINGTSVSWTLGASAYRVGLWDPKFASQGTRNLLPVALLIVLSLIAILLAL